MVHRADDLSQAAFSLQLCATACYTFLCIELSLKDIACDGISSGPTVR